MLETFTQTLWEGLSFFQKGLLLKAGDSMITSYLFFSACLFLCFAAYKDIKVRRFPNELFVLLLLDGIFYSTLNQHFLASFAFFLATTLIGIFLFPVFHLKAGDAKFLSILFFFVRLTESTEQSLFFKTLFIGLVVIGLAILLWHYKNPLLIVQQLKRDLFAIGLSLTGQSKLATKMIVIEKEEVTIPFVAELVLIYFIFLFLLGKGV